MSLEFGKVFGNLSKIALHRRDLMSDLWTVNLFASP